MIRESETPVLVDFYADWCGPCKAVSPVVESLASSYEGKLKVVKVDVDKNPQAAEFYQVRGIPAFILFDKGEIKWRAAGFRSEADFRRELDTLLAA